MQASAQPGFNGSHQGPTTPKRPAEAGTDRDHQDQIIRYLADSTFRDADAEREFLGPDQAARAQRFSRFLVRRYYRDRVTRGFRYSAKLGHEAVSIVDAQEFDSMLDDCILGSFATATKVTKLACSHLAAMRAEPWWHELLEYESAFFLQLATSEVTEPARLPCKGASAILHEFRFPISELLAHVRSDEPIPEGLHGHATLLFSRTGHGKIYVAEVDESTAKIFESVDGTRSSDEIAAMCGLNRDEAQRTLATLAEIGGIILPGPRDGA